MVLFVKAVHPSYHVKETIEITNNILTLSLGKQV